MALHMTGCEIIKCPDYVDGVCQNTLDYVNNDTGEDMCPRNTNAIPRDEYNQRSAPMSEKQTTIDIMNHGSVVQANKDLVDENLTLRADLERVKKEKMTLELLHGKAQKQVVKINTDLQRVTRERDALKDSVKELVKAMHDYEMDVDMGGDEKPYRHRKMMRRATAALAAVKPETCVWTWIDDPYPGGWKTSCKHQHSDYDGRCKKPVGICPYCHKPIEQKEV